jgi:UDP-N-acetylmuramyl pentapeptide phosphotransferase/UDP-N-acetylglucosamine-1-phosphate transferase
VGLVDAPNGRSSHAGATPRAGGLGIPIAGVVAGVACGLPVAAWLPVAGIAALGLVDDRWHVEPLLRLVVQCVLAVASAVWLLRQTGLSVMVAGAAAVVFVLILVGTTNIYNFMDGANGMAGLMGVVVFGTIGVLALTIAEDVEIGRVALIIAAACCGFLPLNLRRRAHVFMGDVCSTFLGFTAALLALRLWMEQPVWGLCALSAMTVFYVDAGLTLLARLRRHERLFEAHRMHAYQRLVNELGWPHPVVAVMYGGIQSAISILLLVSSPWGWGAVVGVLTGVVIVLSCLYWYVQEKATRRI